MKFSKLTTLFTLMIALGFIFTACDNTTDPVAEPVVKYPNAPTALMATSLNETSVSLKWTLSTSEADTNFTGYVVYTDGSGPINVAKGISTFTLATLENAKEYTFTVKSVYRDGKESQTSPSIKWAPAYRFVENINSAPIRLYVSSSSLGSGLNIFDVDGSAPKGLKVASLELWTLGIETKTANVLKFGPASSLDYDATGKTLKTVYLVSTPVFANSLNDVFDSEVLSAKTFSTDFVDLNSLNSNGKNAVFYVKEMRDGKAHYAKVLVKNNNGFLQNDEYIECEVSYQSGDDLPYAK